jgi:hypothetical protein
MSANLDHFDRDLLHAAYKGGLGREERRDGTHVFLWVFEGSRVADDIDTARLDRLINEGWLTYSTRGPYAGVATTPAAWVEIPW